MMRILAVAEEKSQNLNCGIGHKREDALSLMEISQVKKS